MNLKTRNKKFIITINIKIIESVIVTVAYILLRIISSKLIDRTIANKTIQKQRGKIIKKAINLIFFTTCSIFLLLIWGVDQSELAVFISTVLQQHHDL